MKKTYKTILCLGAFILLDTSIAFANDLNATKKDNTIYITMPKVIQSPQSNAVVIPAPHSNAVVITAPESNAIVIPAVKLNVQTQDTPEQNTKQNKSKNDEVNFSKRVPPNYYQKEKASNKTVEVGEISNFRVNAYLRAPLISENEITTRLESAGFTVLGTYVVDKKAKVKSIVFSDKAMTSAASKKSRGFAGTLRVLIDEKSGVMSISNPIYVMKAFMQEEYNSEIATEALKRLRSAFKEVRNSEDIIKVSRLEQYQFMFGMPYYKDMIEVALGDSKSLLERARKSKKVVYEQHLDNGSVVIGIKLSKRTNKFVKKIGYKNAGLLPYPILIEDNRAKILAPKYYIAVTYPMLSMSEFMAIATVPGAIEKECDKLFR